MVPSQQSCRSPKGAFRSQDFLSARTLAGQSALWLLHGLLGVLAVWLSRGWELNRKSAFRAVSALKLAGFLRVITLSEQTVLAIPDDTLYMRQFLAHEKYGEAVRYLDELQAPVRNLTATVWTGDETADYLINSKAAAAEADGIRFQAQVEFPRRTNIRSVDLCAILGNLLDNAIEAARQVSDPSGRTVALTIRRIHQMLVIKVENSFSSVPVQENGELKTIKTGGGLHGWGLKSAQTAAEKYDGMVQAGVSGEVFRAVATLSYQGMEDR